MTLAYANLWLGRTVHDPRGRVGVLARIEHSTGRAVAVVRDRSGRERRCFVEWVFPGKTGNKRLSGR